MKTLFSLSVLASLLVGLTGCFKDDPKKEMMQAGGSWLIKEAVIKTFDATGNELSSETKEDGGLLLLTHNDDFLYEGSYSLSYDTAVFNNSEIGALFLNNDTWGVSNGAKSFNISDLDPSTGYVSLMGSLTILKFRNNKMDLQFIRVNNAGYPIYQEVWKLKRGTHN